MSTLPTDPARSGSKARLAAAYPQVFVTDFARALAYYEQKLGFAVVYTYGDPPTYGLVKRDRAGLNLRHVDQPAIDPQVRDREHLLAAAIPVEGVGHLLEELLGRGAVLAQTLQRQPWGLDDFVVRDPDGNLLCFAEAGRR